MYANHCSFEKCPEFIKLISDYDTFSRKMLPVSDYFKLGYDANFNGYVPTFLLLLDLLMESKLPKMVEEKNEKYNEFKMKKLIDEGKVIKSYVDSENYSYCRTFSYEALIDGYVGLVINKRSNSWVFGDLYNKYKIVCTWVFDGKLYHYSLFSADESVDCAKIAELYGGGGHKGAAGFISNELIYKKKDTI
jgi:oligoribonuclease NrnB/cAMP/cGMP phosphodiesterase (DHH superfamily)